MADVSEVGQALVNVISQAVYPNGLGQPSVAGCDIAIFQGWPKFEALQAALDTGRVQISVFPRPDERVTTVTADEDGWYEHSHENKTGTGIREIRRQTRTFQLTVWANRHDARDCVAKVIDNALATTSRLWFSDGAEGVMTYVNSIQDDGGQKQRIYRRDLFYAVNYPTVQTQTYAVIRHVQMNIAAGPAPDLHGPVRTIITSERVTRENR